MNKKILVIDTETGGLNAETHSILTLGAVVWNDSFIEDKLEITIAEPEIIADAKALEVNGLTVEEVQAKGVSPLQAVMTLQNFLQKNNMRGKVTLGGHNVSFDIPFMRRLYRLAGTDFDKQFSYRYLDTMQIAFLFNFAGKFNLTSVSLDSLTKYYGCSPDRVDGKHGALGDAEATAKCLTKMLASLAAPPPEATALSLAEAA